MTWIPSEVTHLGIPLLPQPAILLAHKPDSPLYLVLLCPPPRAPPTSLTSFLSPGSLPNQVKVLPCPSLQPPSCQLPRSPTLLSLSPLAEPPAQINPTVHLWGALCPEAPKLCGRHSRSSTWCRKSHAVVTSSSPPGRLSERPQNRRSRRPSEDAWVPWVIRTIEKTRRRRGKARG